ncbi:hypothetical protein FHT02_004327 [Sphingomonas xinjiangensis]|uniref:Uncharacterized protein n=1 Tax=Sphingomonas xinjiangensis TaxID=643568 RepID=A0A840YTS6_9SPHN|nr:hypothetical protein [Sphingomonas xinjiangensis]
MVLGLGPLRGGCKRYAVLRTNEFPMLDESSEAAITYDGVPM